MTRRLAWAVTMALALALGGAGCDDDPPKGGGGTGGSPGTDALLDAPGTGGSSPSDARDTPTGGDAIAEVGGDTATDGPPTDVPTNPGLPGELKQVVGPAGGQIVYHGGRLTLVFPRGAFTRPTEVAVSAIAAASAPVGALGTVYDVQPAAEELAKPASVIFKYGAEIGGVSGNELRIGRYLRAFWNDLAGNQVDATKMTVTSDLPGLGPVGLLAGVCRICTTTCDAATCLFGTVAGKCIPYGNGCMKCVPDCDQDGDGFCPGGTVGEPRPDCRDNNINMNPEAPEICGNDIDENCDDHQDEGCTACTADEQCKGKEACLGGLCEVCQANCDPAGCRFGMDATNPGVAGKCLDFGRGCNKCVPTCDLDGDGYCPAPVPPEINQVGVDCIDTNREVHPGAAEICGNNLDDDCSGYIDDKCESCGEGKACPRNGFACVAGACEGCQKLCDPAVACNLTTPGSPDPGPEGKCIAYGTGCTRCVPKCDGDGDGFCKTSTDPAIPANDCDDENATMYPGAAEICNERDDDCDDHTDETCLACSNDEICSSGESCNNGACDSCGNSCDEINCRFGVVEGMPGSGVPGKCMDYGKGNGCKKCVPPCDGDGDGFCAGPDTPGFKGGDCRDDLLTANPDAAEICGNNIDDDCDGLTDEACRSCAVGAACATNESCSTLK